MPASPPPPPPHTSSLRTPDTPPPQYTPSPQYTTTPTPHTIISIDFGTTHSAIAFATTASPTTYELLTHYPHNPNSSAPKVPSTISYPPSGGPPQWGFSVPASGAQPISFIKLLLDASQARPTFVSPRTTTLPAGKTPVGIVADYLSGLRTHALAMIARRGLGVEVVEYILTVPAVWSDKARSQMVDAARRAGMERVGLVGEPEAAAEYALRSVEGVRVGECFVVCDAGGGTVDLISYGVLGVDPLRVGEVAVGTGALGGAVYLDRRFEELLERRVGAGVVAGMAPQARAQMFEYWEHSIKRPFSGPTGEDYFLPMMGTISAGVEGGFLRITRQEVTSIFTPIISQILSLIKAQASSSPSTPRSILLVGGLGSNEHLYTHLTAWSTAHSITILQPPDAWTAVVRGAILRALRGTTVSAHMSRQSYGIVHSARWDPNAHPVSSREWHSLRNEWVVRDLMQWYIHRGDISTPATVLSFPFYRTLKESEVTGPTHVLRTELWVCDSPSSPPALRDASVRKLCVMKSAPVPVERFIKTRNAAGKVFYRVDYSLDMAVVGGVVVYEMSMAGKGKGKEKGERVKVGRVEVEYE